MSEWFGKSKLVTKHKGYAIFHNKYTTGKYNVFRISDLRRGGYSNTILKTTKSKEEAKAYIDRRKKRIKKVRRVGAWRLM
jgi:hypothetical protein